MTEDLDRFIEAQHHDGTYESAVAELRAGRKRGHWMWFVFPQLAGLGSSPTAQFYALHSIDEARAYAAHAVLGRRLVACSRALLSTEGRSAVQILGSTDALKLRSSATLFERAAPHEPVFGELLDRFYDGKRDLATLALL